MAPCFHVDPAARPSFGRLRAALATTTYAPEPGSLPPADNRFPRLSGSDVQAPGVAQNLYSLDDGVSLGGLGAEQWQTLPARAARLSAASAPAGSVAGAAEPRPGSGSGQDPAPGSAESEAETPSLDTSREFYSPFANISMQVRRSPWGDGGQPCLTVEGEWGVLVPPPPPAQAGRSETDTTLGGSADGSAAHRPP